MELPQATPLQLKALKNEDKAENELDKICDLYRFHYEENNSQNREYYLQKFGKLMDRARQKYRLILFIRGTTSIPPTVDEEEDVSLEELIPSFFFDEEEDDSPMLKSIFSVLDEYKNNSTRAGSFKFQEIDKSSVNVFEKDNLKNQMKLGECLNIILNSPRSIFDRGKSFRNLILSSGFKSDFGFDSKNPLCVPDTDIHVDGKLLVKMTESLSGNLGSVIGDLVLQVQQDRVSITMLPMDMCVLSTNFFLTNTLHTRMPSRLCFTYAAKVFYRGKELKLLKGLFSFNCAFKDYLDTNTCCVIVGTESTFMETYCDKFVYELIVECRYCYVVLYECLIMPLFVKEEYSCDASKLFDKGPQGSNILWTILIFQVPRPSASCNELYLSAKLLASFRFCFAEVFTSGSFILHVGSISIAYHTENFVHRFISMHGLESDSSFRASIALVSVSTGDISDSGQLFSKSSQENRTTMTTYLYMWMLLCETMNELFHQFLDMCEEEKFLLQLKYIFTDAISVCQLRYILLTSAATVFHIDLKVGIVARRESDVLQVLVPLVSARTIARAFLLGALFWVSVVKRGQTIMLPKLFQNFHYLSMLVFSVPTIVFHIFQMMLWVGYLRWKFRWVPPGVCSVRNVTWLDKNLISILCSGLKWDSSSWNLFVAQVLQVYEVEKAPEGFGRLHGGIWCNFSKSADFLQLWLPTTIYHGVCKVKLQASSYYALLPLVACISPSSCCFQMLFDRGKIAGMKLLFVGLLDINWNYASNWFCKAEVYNQIAANLQKSIMFLTNLWSS